MRIVLWVKYAPKKNENNDDKIVAVTDINTFHATFRHLNMAKNYAILLF